jgi:hypothetical protein
MLRCLAFLFLFLPVSIWLFSIKLDCLGLVQERKHDNSAEQIASLQ